MAYTFRIDATLGVIVARFEGAVGTEQLERVRLEIEAHADFRPGLDRIWDERAAELDITGDPLRTLAAHWNQSAASHTS